MDIRILHKNRPAVWGRKHILPFISALLFAGCSYQVDTTIDAPDANPGDYRCERSLRTGESREAAEAEGLCTLRAAIMEANALAGDKRLDTRRLESGYEFCVPYGDEWVHFWICDPEGAEDDYPIEEEEE